MSHVYVRGRSLKAIVGVATRTARSSFPAPAQNWVGAGNEATFDPASSLQLLSKLFRQWQVGGRLTSQIDSRRRESGYARLGR